MDDTSFAPIDLDVKKTVKKNNMLNELRDANASLVEYRLFCVYLAHLSMTEGNDTVIFRLADYAKIAGLKHAKKADLDAQSDNLLDMKAKIESPDGGFRKFTLFSEFALFKHDEEWMVSLTCNPGIAPMIREQKGKFLRYKLYNTIFLKSYNQQRLYELLKQYERIGERTITLADLREFLSISKNEYPVWGDFSQKVLKVSQKALKESTDICFEFDPIRANKRGKPVVAVKFTISKNKDFVDRLQLDEHLPASGEADNYDGDEIRKTAPEDNSQETQPEESIRNKDPDRDEDQISLFDVADKAEVICKKLFPELAKAGVQEIAALTMSYFAAKLPGNLLPSENEIKAYLRDKRRAMDLSHKNDPIKSHRAYLRAVIKSDTDKAMQSRDLVRTEMIPHWMDPKRPRELDEDELQAIDRMMAEDLPNPSDDP